jgi:hypothetical protein
MKQGNYHMTPDIQDLHSRYHKQINRFSQRLQVVAASNKKDLARVKEAAVAEGLAWLAASDFL